MPETYDEIIKEIEHKDVFGYCAKHGINMEGTSTTEDERNVMKHIAARVREAVGGDPCEWWVLDADGNHVHIGDHVSLGESAFKVENIGVVGGKPAFCYYHSSGWLYIEHAHKVIPDTRERIITDTIDKLSRNKTAEGRLEIIREAIDRAMKLAESHEQDLDDLIDELKAEVDK